MTGTAIVTTTGLTKRYGPVVALDGLDLEIPRGVVFGLLGPNGAGKTTTMRLLAGLARPTAGRAIVAGIEAGPDTPELQRRIGYLDQDPRFYGWMRGRELLELVGRLHGFEGTRLRERVRETLVRIGLEDAGERRVGAYSGGMRQRLGIGQAIVAQPDLLILDEPVSSLDPAGRRDLLALVGELRASSTVLFSTHVLADVERVCDRVAILDRGRLVTQGPLSALLHEYAGPVYRLDPEPGQDAQIDRLIARLRTLDWVTAVAVDGGIVSVSVANPEAAGRALLAEIVDAGMALVSFERQRPTLEDVFLRLVAPGPAGRRDGSAA